ncbi:MAG: polysaccharide biosynthesis/export family protein [Bacteroidota bacterium]
MRKILLYISFALLLSSCGIINPSMMLKTKRSFVYDTYGDTIERQYKISPNDVIEFRMYSNDGFRLIDLTSQNVNPSQNSIARSFSYDVEFDGTVKFPVLGRIKLAGLTVRESELMLQEEFTKYYNKPFVLINVTSKRIIIFPGATGDAKVVQLNNDNTTLMEVIATSGGIAGRGKAKKIKLIRGEYEKRKVYLIDLSKIEGLKQGDIVLQSNDIIYIEPRADIARGILTEISPLLGLVSTTLLIITLVRQTQ